MYQAVETLEKKHRGGRFTSTQSEDLKTLTYSVDKCKKQRALVRKAHGDEYYVSPSFWGHKYWSLIQILCLVSTSTAKQRQLLDEFLLRHLPMSLPCNACKLNYMIHQIKCQNKLRGLITRATNAKGRAKLLAAVLEMRINVTRVQLGDVYRTAQIQQAFLYRVLGVFVDIGHTQESINTMKPGVALWEVSLLSNADKIDNVTKLGLPFITFKNDLKYFINLMSFIYPSGSRNRTEFDNTERLKAESIIWILQSLPSMLGHHHEALTRYLVKYLFAQRGARQDLEKELSVASYDRSNLIVFLYGLQSALIHALRSWSADYGNNYVIEIYSSSVPGSIRRNGRRAEYTLTYHCQKFRNLIRMREAVSVAERSMPRTAIVNVVNNHLPLGMHIWRILDQHTDSVQESTIFKVLMSMARDEWKYVCMLKEKNIVKFANDILQEKVSTQDKDVFLAAREATAGIQNMLEMVLHNDGGGGSSVSNNNKVPVGKQCMAYNFRSGVRCTRSGFIVEYTSRTNEKNALKSGNMLRLCTSHMNTARLQQVYSACSRMTAKLTATINEMSQLSTPKNSSKPDNKEESSPAKDELSSRYSEDKSSQISSYFIAEMMMVRLLVSRQSLVAIALLRLLLHPDVPGYIILHPQVAKDVEKQSDLFIEEFRYQRRYALFADEFRSTNATTSNEVGDMLRNISRVGDVSTRVYRIKLHAHFAKHEFAKWVLTENVKVLHNIPTNSIIIQESQDANKKDVTLGSILEKVLSTSA